MRSAWKKIRYRLEWLGLKFATKFLPLLSRKACYRLALWLGSLGAMLDRRGRRVGLSKHISESCRAQFWVDLFELVYSNRFSSPSSHRKEEGKRKKEEEWRFE